MSHALRETWRAARAILAMRRGRPSVVPRLLGEDAIPVWSIAGSARDCGREYAERVRSAFPGYERYLSRARSWRGDDQRLAQALARQAPHLDDFHAGVADVVGDSTAGVPQMPPNGDCTSFAAAPATTLDRVPIAGQNKDTDAESASLYIVLRIRMTGAPAILTVAYPGELLGYGFWSTGMSVFRNSLQGASSAARGAPMSAFGLLALSSRSATEVEEHARRIGLMGSGNFVFADAEGGAIALEWNGRGLSVLYGRDGILTHANHAVGAETSEPDAVRDGPERHGSEHRMSRLDALLRAEAGRLTAQRAYMALGDHAGYPDDSVCRHAMRGSIHGQTTTAIVAEPTRGLLHVTRGNPCANWPTTISIT